MQYRTLLVDPPWQQQMVLGFNKTRNNRPKKLPYPTLSVAQIGDLPIPDLAEANAHLWLWTTNQFLPDEFDLLKRWGFKYMIPIQWVKPSGCGAWWIHRSQTLLFGYRGKLDMREKLKPNVLFAPARRHSQKPEESFGLIEAVSHAPRLEMFARAPRLNWHSWGDEVVSDIELKI